MKMKLKLYAQLGQYLPDNANANEADIDVIEGKTVIGLLNDYSVPLEMCHLVLVNGAFVPPATRESHALSENDHLAAWPPVAGG